VVFALQTVGRKGYAGFVIAYRSREWLAAIIWKHRALRPVVSVAVLPDTVTHRAGVSLWAVPHASSCGAGQWTIRAASARLR
jgi:hypothetical protein